ncbi:MAG TPA: hypothetical protein VLQ76_03505 [Bacteroidales bacterium]|nr:hypothetical protein [Bacteroidales bacterium]
MAVRNDNDLPELVPFDDRLPSRTGLFRRAEEITDDQFALLAAEWAEGECGADSISEIETIFAVSPEKRALAEDFKRIRLVPGNEEWPGREAMIKALPPSFYLNRIMYAVLASAAVLLAFLTLSPLLRYTISQSDPAMLPQVNIAAAAILPEATIAAAAVIPASNPVPATERRTAAVIQTTTPAVPQAEKLQADAGHNPRIQPFDFRNGPETVRLIAGVSTAELTTVDRMPVSADIRSLPAEANWIMRGISALSGIVTGKDQPVDGYMIAGACVKGINSVLGWDMDLERVMSDDGNPLEVNFSSSLVSFSAPAKKSTDEP